MVVLGIPFKDVSFNDVVAWTKQRIQTRNPGYIATANMDFIMQAWRDPEQQRILLEADLVVADGIPIVWLSRLMGFGLKERVTGSDLVPLFAEMCAREGFSIYGLGGAPGVAEKATAVLQQRYPGLRVAGCYSPPKADVLTMNHAEILTRLDRANPDLLLVAFGAPKQEKWVNMHIHAWRVPVSIGIGGSLDFLAGTQKRAPKIVQKFALEWLWRMLSDPPRLFKRYSSNIFFFSCALLKLVAIRLGPRTCMAHEAITPDDHTLSELHIQRIPFPDSADRHAVDAFQSACATANGHRVRVIELGTRNWLNILELGLLIEARRLCHATGARFCVYTQHTKVINEIKFVHLDHYLHLVTGWDAIIATAEAHRKHAASTQENHLSEGVLTLHLPQELTAATLDVFKEKTESAWRAFEQHHPHTGVVIDASATEFLDSAALGFLNLLRTHAQHLDATFTSQGFHGAALQTLRIARLDTLFLPSQEKPKNETTP